MAATKTQPTKLSPAKFLKAVEDEAVRKDCRAVLGLMKEETSRPAVMWGTSLVGFGQYHYKYKSGREGDWFITGFSPRKRGLVVYIMNGFSKYETLMNKTGKFRTGVSCLYIRKLDDIDIRVLRQLVRRSVRDMQKNINAPRHPDRYIVVSYWLPG